MSLPKIKSATIDNTEATGSQKNLKFKKIRVGTDQATNM